jgi:type VII secretion integral membrane protein EccD
MPVTSVTSGRAPTPAPPAPRDPAGAPAAAAGGLAKVTVNAPRRRLDVALPEHAPLAELLPELLRQAGVGLADEGQAHGGWVLRRVDGVALTGGTGLVAQGVRDGDVLYLGPARGAWPELEYDDVVDAIAAGARRYGRSWDAGATRATGLAVAGVALLLGALALVRSPAGPVVSGGLGLAVAAVLVLAGAVVSRAYADAVSGAALAAFALPYGLAGGAALVAPGVTGPGAPRLLVGAVAVLLVAAAAMVAIGHGLRIFVGAATAGALGAAAALTGYRLPAAGTAAIVLSALLVGAGAVPVLAVRLGNLPMPVLAGQEPERPDRARVYAAVVRTDEILTGLLSGLSVAAVCCAVVLARSGGTGGVLLVLVSSVGLLLRGRLFATVRQRLPLLVAGCAGLGALLLHWPDRSATPFALLAAALVAAVAGIRYRGRPPGPYLGRAADLLDAACVVSAVPVAVAVLGLYGRVRGMIG